MDLMRRTGRELRAVLRAETPTHRRYRDHLTVIVAATIGVDLVCTVLAYLLERHAAGTEIDSLGSAFSGVSTELLTVSSSIRIRSPSAAAPSTSSWRHTRSAVVATLAGATGAFIQKRGLELEGK